VVETRVWAVLDSYEEFLVPVLKKKLEAVPVPVPGLVFPKN
jgi:hypothetical protein